VLILFEREIEFNYFKGSFHFIPSLLFSDDFGGLYFSELTVALTPVPPCVGFAGWALGGMVGSALLSAFFIFYALWRHPLIV